MSILNILILPINCTNTIKKINQIFPIKINQFFASVCGIIIKEMNY